MLFQLPRTAMLLTLVLLFIGPGGGVAFGKSHPTTASALPVSAGLGFDPNASPETQQSLISWLSFGSKIELEYVSTTHTALHTEGEDAAATFVPELSLALSADPSRYVRAFLDVKLTGEIEHHAAGADAHRAGFEVTEAFLLVKHLWSSHVAVQVGRQKFTDSREWLYDDELDAARVYYLFPQGTIELAVMRQGLVNKDLLQSDHPTPRTITLVYSTYAPYPTLRLAAYSLRRDDSAQRESPWFMGLHAEGQIMARLHYWLEWAHVRGRDGALQVRGFGGDIGGTYVLPLPFEPALTLGYAFGTGDGDPTDQTDRRFRQTGLQGNKGKFQGVVDLQYYGELLDPELSNIALWTASVGFKPSRQSSVELVYHDYRQHIAAATLSSGGLHATPEGHHTHLGRAVDLVLGYKEMKPFELTVVLGYFMPGKAFPSTSADSFFLRLNLQCEF